MGELMDYLPHNNLLLLVLTRHSNDHLPAQSLTKVKQISLNIKRQKLLKAIPLLRASDEAKNLAGIDGANGNAVGFCFSGSSMFAGFCYC